jgi:hypothetical protein
MKKLNAQGYGLVELCIAMLILTCIAESLVILRLVKVKKTVAFQDRGYAAMKALQMLEELKARANTLPVYGAHLLDGYHDGEKVKPVLTTDPFVDKPGGDPGDPLSGNRKTNGHWRYLRRIRVQPVEEDPLARRVVIQVWKFASHSDPTVPGLLLATLDEKVKAYSP